jgi:hypothetical protein
MNDFEKDCERVIKQVKLERLMQQKRMFEQAKRQRKAERLSRNEQRHV